MKQLIKMYAELDKNVRHKIDSFLWTTFNWILSILITYLSWLDYWFIIILIPVLNTITKQLNKHFNPFYWE